MVSQEWCEGEGSAGREGSVGVRVKSGVRERGVRVDRGVWVKSGVRECGSRVARGSGQCGSRVA